MRRSYVSGYRWRGGVTTVHSVTHLELREVSGRVHMCTWDVVTMTILRWGGDRHGGTSRVYVCVYGRWGEGVVSTTTTVLVCVLLLGLGAYAVVVGTMTFVSVSPTVGTHVVVGRGWCP